MSTLRLTVLSTRECLTSSTMAVPVRFGTSPSELSALRLTSRYLSLSVFFIDCDCVGLIWILRSGLCECDRFVDCVEIEHQLISVFGSLCGDLLAFAGELNSLYTGSFLNFFHLLICYICSHLCIIYLRNDCVLCLQAHINMLLLMFVHSNKV